MSGSVNKVILIGHLGRDPEIRRTADGRPIATLSLATSESWRDRTSGERRERTEWHRVVIFTEGLAKSAEKHLKKGSKVYLEGQLQTREWEDRQGIKRSTTEVVLNGFAATMTMLDNLPSNRPPPPEDPDDYGRTSTRPSDAGHGGGDLPPRDVDDEIVF